YLVSSMRKVINTPGYPLPKGQNFLNGIPVSTAGDIRCTTMEAACQVTYVIMESRLLRSLSQLRDEAER
ncbi:hypothetical protein STEG23_007343, partial [Scotinomys teguina]